MNLTNLLFEPYTIILIISIILTVISYFVVQSDNKDKDEEDQTNLSTALLYTFLGSFIGLMALKFGLGYLNKNNVFQKGGLSDISDKLTIIADDIDVGFMES